MKSYLGKNSEGLNCFIEWKLDKGKFSASGFCMNRAGTDHEQGGQMLDELLEYFPEHEQMFMIHRVWKKYHLNDMKAGSPKQEELIDNLIGPAYEKRKGEVREHNSTIYDAERQLKRIIADKCKTDDREKIDYNYKKILSLVKGMNLKDNKLTWFVLVPYWKVDRLATGVDYSDNKLTISNKLLNTVRMKTHDTPSHYDFVCSELEKLGRLRDPDYLVDGVAYKYGSKWPKEELPPEVIEEIQSWVEVPFTEKTIIQQLVEKCGAKLEYVRPDKEVSGRSHYKLKIGKYSFPYFCGPSGATAEDALGCVLRDAYVGKDGYELAQDYLIDELGYEDLKEVRRVAKACVDTYQKLVYVGLWDSEVEELAREI